MRLSVVAFDRVTEGFFNIARNWTHTKTLPIPTHVHLDTRKTILIFTSTTYREESVLKVTVKGETRDIKTVWMEGQTVYMIDQIKLPYSFEIVRTNDYKETAERIRDMTIRGAGAIGVAAAFGVAQAAFQANNKEFGLFCAHVEQAARSLKETRPTAMNLFHAVDRCLGILKQCSSIHECRNKIVEEAKRIMEEDIEASRRIGEYGNGLISDGDGILTHCNAGALAFVDYGTALSPIRMAHSIGKRLTVFVDETRPRCQGARLTAWELLQEGIDHSIIVDNAAGYYMWRNEIQLAIVGADRIAVNGDTANKIGTYEKAVLAKENRIPFYVAAPSMTFDLERKNGNSITIEERSEEEVEWIEGLDQNNVYGRVRITPQGSPARNPSFDITPARYVTAFITDRGIVQPPYEENIKKTFAKTQRKT